MTALMTDNAPLPTRIERDLHRLGPEMREHVMRFMERVEELPSLLPAAADEGRVSVRITPLRPEEAPLVSRAALTSEPIVRSREEHDYRYETRDFPLFSLAVTLFEHLLREDYEPFWETVKTEGGEVTCLSVWVPGRCLKRSQGGEQAPFVLQDPLAPLTPAPGVERNLLAPVVEELRALRELTEQRLKTQVGSWSDANTDAFLAEHRRLGPEGICAHPFEETLFGISRCGHDAQVLGLALTTAAACVTLPHAGSMHTPTAVVNAAEQLAQCRRSLEASEPFDAGLLAKGLRTAADTLLAGCEPSSVELQKSWLLLRTRVDELVDSYHRLLRGFERLIPGQELNEFTAIEDRASLDAARLAALAPLLEPDGYDLRAAVSEGKRVITHWARDEGGQTTASGVVVYTRDGIELLRVQSGARQPETLYRMLDRVLIDAQCSGIRHLKAEISAADRCLFTVKGWSLASALEEGAACGGKLCGYLPTQNRDRIDHGEQMQAALSASGEIAWGDCRIDPPQAAARDLVAAFQDELRAFLRAAHEFHRLDAGRFSDFSTVEFVKEYQRRTARGSFAGHSYETVLCNLHDFGEQIELLYDAFSLLAAHASLPHPEVKKGPGALTIATQRLRTARAAFESETSPLAAKIKRTLAAQSVVERQIDLSGSVIDPLGDVAQLLFAACKPPRSKEAGGDQAAERWAKEEWQALTTQTERALGTYRMRAWYYRPWHCGMPKMVENFTTVETAASLTPEKLVALEALAGEARPKSGLAEQRGLRGGVIFDGYYTKEFFQEAVASGQLLISHWSRKEAEPAELTGFELEKGGSVELLRGGARLAGLRLLDRSMLEHQLREARSAGREDLRRLEADISVVNVSSLRTSMEKGWLVLEVPDRARPTTMASDTDRAVWLRGAFLLSPADRELAGDLMFIAKPLLLAAAEIAAKRHVEAWRAARTGIAV
jgi:hypothetical protein